MTDSITPEMRELQQHVYKAAADEGLQLPGRSDWTDFKRQTAGSKDGPGADIGLSGEMNVPVGADGRLVNRAPDRGPDDAPSTHLLKIHVTPFVEFGDDGNVPHIRWLANVTVFELTKARIVLTSDSSDDEAIKAMQGEREYLEYANDPEYREARLRFHHDNPQDAVREALRRISDDGRINLPGPPDPATSAPVAAPPAETESDGGSGKKIAAVAAAAAAAIVAVVVGLNLGGDDSTSVSTSDPVAEEPADEAPAIEPIEQTDEATEVVTVEPVGEVAEEPPVDLRICGSFPGDAGPGNAGTFLDVGSSPCLPGPDSYSSGTCDPVFLACSDGSTIFVGAGGAPGTSHQYGATDADTGQQGASTELFAFVIRLFGLDTDAVARVTSDCGGNILTGESPVVAGGITIVEQPLLSYGPCTVTDAEVRATNPATGTSLDRAIVELIGHEYTVDAGEGDPEAPGGLERSAVFLEPFEIPERWTRPALTVNGTLAAAPISDDCFWFFAPTDVDLLVRVLDGCSSNAPFWVFAAGLTDVEVTLEVTDTVLGHGAAYVNPLGVPAPPVADTAAFATSRPLFGEPAVFPCGYGDVGYTACPASSAPADAGGFVSVSAATFGSIPIEGDGADRSHTIDFGPAGGPAYTVTQDAAGWSLSSSMADTRARAVFRDNSVTLIAPDDELPDGALSYVWSTTVNGQMVVQPEVPVAGLITTPSVPADGEPVDETIDEPVDEGETGEPPPAEPAGPTETLGEFYTQLSASISSGDIGFSLDRLHPAVFEAYPDSCPAALESFADPDFSIEFISEGETGPWTWDIPDGPSLEIPDAIEVMLTVSGRGQAGTETTSHVAVVDGEYRWFTFCR